MALSSPVYLLFLGIVWLAVRVLPGARWKKFSLLAASLVFYALLDLRYLALLLLVSVATYGLGLAIGRGRRAGVWVGIGIAFALIILAVFKYSVLWLPIISRISPSGFGRDRFDPISWLLPLGISFYTFQAISYLIDIYRGRLEPVRDVADFGLYLIFFPKIIAGPIVRPTDFFREIPNGPRPAGRKNLPEIFSLFLRGLFKKSSLRIPWPAWPGSVFKRRRCRARRSSPRRSIGGVFTCLRFRFTPIFPVTPTSRARPRRSSESRCRRISATRISPPRSPNFGIAGT